MYLWEILSCMVMHASLFPLHMQAHACSFLTRCTPSSSSCKTVLWKTNDVFFLFAWKSVLCTETYFHAGDSLYFYSKELSNPSCVNFSCLSMTDIQNSCSRFFLQLQNSFLQYVNKSFTKNFLASTGFLKKFLAATFEIACVFYIETHDSLYGWVILFKTPTAL